jgi:hypothetical protein
MELDAYKSLLEGVGFIDRFATFRWLEGDTKQYLE